MYDRIEFTKSIKYKESIESTIKDHFDEIMGLYDLIGKEKNICISTDISNSIISFDLEFKTEEDATKLKDIIATQSISIYSHRYYTNCVQNRNILNIILLEVLG